MKSELTQSAVTPLRGVHADKQHRSLVNALELAVNIQQLTVINTPSVHGSWQSIQELIVNTWSMHRN